MAKYLSKELTYKIRGALYEVYNTLGPGFKESVYHRALIKEFTLRKIPFEEKKELPILFKGDKVGIYEPDFIIDEKVLMEIKAVPEMPKIYETQLFYYLRGTKYKLGFLVNFGGSKLEIKRRIYERTRKRRFSQIKTPLPAEASAQAGMTAD